MKKYISAFLAALLLMIFPFVSIKAEGIPSNQKKKAFTAQVKQKKQIIRQKTLDIKDIESQLDNRVNQMSDALKGLLTRETTPTEDMVYKIQEKQKVILNTLIRINKLDKALRIENHEAKADTAKGNYSHALLHYDNIISLLEKEKVLFKSYSANMQEFIELIESSHSKRKKAVSFILTVS